MNKPRSYEGSHCRRCGAAYALRPGIQPDELHCTICGAAYYLVPTQPAAPDAPQDAPTVDGFRKILLADDETGVLDLISATLEGDPEYQLLRATNGSDAVRIAREAKPDVVLMDVMMPVMTGLEACKILKSDPATRSLFVILLTARASSADIALGMDAGADDYVVKPFSPSYLLERIDGLFLRSSA